MYSVPMVVGSCFIEHSPTFHHLSSRHCLMQVKPLSIRHIKYGVKAEYVKYFGIVLTNVLGNMLGLDFTERAKLAWTYAWGGVSRCIAECLSIGSNLITVALVTDSCCSLIVDVLELTSNDLPRLQEKWKSLNER